MNFVYTEFAQAGQSEYGPAWMWIWNDVLTEEKLRLEVGDMHSRAPGTLMPVPEPKEFRPDSMVTCLSPEYLGREYMTMYRTMVEQAKRLGSQVWIYDEGGWPSGTVCWSLPAKYPQYRSQFIVQQQITPRSEERVLIPADCLCAFMVTESNTYTKLTPGSQLMATSKTDRILIYHIGTDPHYTDLLNPQATQLFIDLVHEKYKAAISEHFGDTVTAVFSDEPKMAVTPWTNGLAKLFEERSGYDLLDKLYALFEGDEHEQRQVRVDYTDLISELWSQTYFGMIQKWCRQKHLEFVCHLDNDQDLASHARHNGNPMRQYRQMDIPAVDVIWRQIFPGNPTDYFPKFAASVAHQQGRPRVCSETFCVYGNGLTPAQMKWILDYQFVRGVNWFMPGVYQYSTREFFQAGERPIFGPGDPLWKHLGGYFDYVTRLSYLLTRGVPDESIALYTPFRDIWAGAQSGDPTDQIAVKLLETQCDFDFIDDDALGDSALVTDGRLIIGEMSYDTLVVPQCEWMSAQAVATLQQFAASCGQVLWVGEDISSPIGCTSISLSEISSYVKPVVTITAGNDKLRVCRRRLDDGSLYLITNEHTEEISATLVFDETCPPVILDPETGNCWKPQEASYEDGRWIIPLIMPFAGSCVVMFTERDYPVSDEPAQPGEVLQSLDSGWECRKLKSHALGRDDYELTDMPNEPYVATSLGDWREVFGAEFSGDGEYSIEFECVGAVAAQACSLDLGDVRYVCEVVLNGKSLGVRLWPPWSFNIAGKLKQGSNKLNVIVTNTMANQYVYSHQLDGYASKYLGSYHQRALAFERESVSSGLYGPVTICVTDIPK
ncbi:MAG: glycosyl hydrolase [Armatimonadota bacterium]